MEFMASLSPDSLRQISLFYGASTLLEPTVQAVLDKGANTIAETAKQNTETAFMNPRGVLRESIAPVRTSLFEVQVVVGVPYGHRREYSFKGPDSLGRMFPNDPAEPYLMPAFDANEPIMLAEVEQAIEGLFTGGRWS